MGINYGDIFWSNAFRDATPTYSASDIPAYAVANLFDWRDFSLYVAQEAATIDTVVSSNRTLSHVIWWVATFYSGAYAEVSYESAPSTFTILATISLAANGLQSATFSPVTVLSGRRVRVKFLSVGSNNVFLRQLFLGTSVTFPVGEWVDKTPHALQSGFVVENVISMNGSIIARNIRRVEKSGVIDLEYVTESWVRTVWEPFITHAKRYPFFYRWNPAEYPSDVIFAAADQINPPKNMSPPPFMHVILPFKGITE